MVLLVFVWSFRIFSLTQFPLKHHPKDRWYCHQLISQKWYVIVVFISGWSWHPKPNCTLKPGDRPMPFHPAIYYLKPLSLLLLASPNCAWSYLLLVISYISASISSFLYPIILGSDWRAPKCKMAPCKIFHLDVAYLPSLDFTCL